MTAVKSLNVHHHSADYIVTFFGITESVLVALEIEYLVLLNSYSNNFARYTDDLDHVAVLPKM